MGYSKHALGFDSIKVKFVFNILVCNVYVVKNYAREDFKRNFKYSLIP